jgi:hypothetical protein
MAKRKEAGEAVHKDLTGRNINQVDEYKRHFQKSEKTFPVATRLTKPELDALKSYAIKENRRLSTILQEWVRDRMQTENITVGN